MQNTVNRILMGSSPQGIPPLIAGQGHDKRSTTLKK